STWSVTSATTWLIRLRRPEEPEANQALTTVVNSYLDYGYTDHVVPPRPGDWANSGCQRDAGGYGMGKWHQRSVWWSWLVSVLAVVGLGLGLTTVPVSATTSGPSTLALDRLSDRPAAPLDP